MNFLLVSKSVSAHVRGGMETHVEDTARVLREMGHGVRIITTSSSGNPLTTLDGIPIEFLDSAPAGLHSRAWWKASAECVRKTLAAGFGDAIISFGIGGYGVAIEKMPVPHYAVAYGRTIGHLKSEWRNCRDWLAVLSYPKHAAALLYLGWIESRLWTRVDGVFATDDELASELTRRGYRASLCYNGVDCRQFKPDAPLRSRVRSELGFTKNSMVMLVASTINYQKGAWIALEEFLSMADEFPSLNLLVVGDGPDLKHLKDRASRSQSQKRILFLGSADRSALPGYYAASDIYVLPTLREEGLPFSLLYALASGVPSIASSVGGVRAAIRQDKTGLLTPLGDQSAVAEAIRRLLTDEALRSLLSRNGRTEAERRFDVHLVTKKLVDEIASRGVPVRRGSSTAGSAA